MEENEEQEEKQQLEEEEQEAKQQKQAGEVRVARGAADLNGRKQSHWVTFHH